MPKISSILGLSPHIRGNLNGNPNSNSCRGSIPAHTGEPPLHLHHSHCTGSIPAHTGEPSWSRIVKRASGVYPRTYGGTVPAQPGAFSREGLSPHIRGNLHQFGRVLSRYRSIPAHTGEPGWGHFRVGFFTVYPRTYGGTGIHPDPSTTHLGLSPHIRGNHCLQFSGLDRDGSIPAHTGEPIRTGRRFYQPTVYPRTYGGTEAASWAIRIVKGLSPHIRGNRVSLLALLFLFGSIPAHTGEPDMRVNYGSDKRVYPRTYGGTKFA